MILKNSPAFQQLKSIKKYSAALGRYSKCTLEEFIFAYNNQGLKGREPFDSLMKSLSPDMVSEEPQPPVVNSSINTVFPSSFCTGVTFAEAYRQMITELLIYFGQTSTIPKNAKRETICDLYFNKYLTPKEIHETANVSLPTIIDNFLVPLFRKGSVDEILLNPVFKSTLDHYFDTALYSSINKVQNDLQLDAEDILQILYLFNYTVYEDQENGQIPIIIRKGDNIRVSECLKRLFAVLNEELLPISKHDLYSKLTKIVSQEKWLPNYIDTAIASNESIATTAEGLIYLKDEAVKGAIYRIRRIVYNSPSHIARKDDIVKTYKALYGGEEPNYDPRNLIKLNVYSISKGGVYQYTENGKRPETVHEFIDKYRERYTCWQ